MPEKNPPSPLRHNSLLEVQTQNLSQGGIETSQISGKSFCVTGSFDTLSRDEIHEMVEQHGGEVRTSVSVKLEYLIAGDNAGSKKSKAEECGVQIISINEFLKMIS